MGAELLIQLLISLTAHAGEIATLLQTAKSEGRDVTDAEVDAIVARDDAAKKALADAIATSRAG